MQGAGPLPSPPEVSLGKTLTRYFQHFLNQVPLNRAAQINWRQKRRSCHDRDQSQYFSLVCFAITGWLGAAVPPPGQICSRPGSPRLPARVQEAGDPRSPLQANGAAPGLGVGGARGRGRPGLSYPRVQRALRAPAKASEPAGFRSRGGICTDSKISRTHVAIVVHPSLPFLSFPLPPPPPHPPRLASPVLLAVPGCSSPAPTPSRSLLNC